MVIPDTKAMLFTYLFTANDENNEYHVILIGVITIQYFAFRKYGIISTGILKYITV